MGRNMTERGEHITTLNQCTTYKGTFRTSHRQEVLDQRTFLCYRHSTEFFSNPSFHLKSYPIYRV